MPELTNRDIIDDVNAMRQELQLPEKRNYSLKTREHGILVDFDQDVTVTTTNLFDTLDEYGYRMKAGNFDRNIAVGVSDADSDTGVRLLFEKRGDGA